MKVLLIAVEEGEEEEEEERGGESQKGVLGQGFLGLD